MIHSNFIPENIRRLMSPSAQKHYGLMTNDESEKHMQDRFEKWCREVRLQHVRPRMDKKTTVQRGVFDFLLWRHAKLVWVEFKTDRGRLSSNQAIFLADQIKDGTPALVAHSVDDACEFVQKHLL